MSFTIIRGLLTFNRKNRHEVNYDQFYEDGWEQTLTFSQENVFIYLMKVRSLNFSYKYYGLFSI